MSFRKPSYRTLNKGLQAFVGLIAVLCYLAANVQFEHFHAYVHHDDAAISHSVADERDPCHRKLYHHDFSKGCAHKTHVSASEKCSLCDHHLSVEKVLSSNEHITDLDGTLLAPSATYFSVPRTFHKHLPARGPPTA